MPIIKVCLPLCFSVRAFLFAFLYFPGESLNTSRDCSPRTAIYGGIRIQGLPRRRSRAMGGLCSNGPWSGPFYSTPATHHSHSLVARRLNVEAFQPDVVQWNRLKES